MEPQIRFCTSADGTRIGYATFGAGPPLVMPTGWAGIEAESTHPHVEAYRKDLSERRLFVQFDRRGLGASQREVSDLSLESQVEDIGAVVNHLQLERFDMFGAPGDAGAVVAAYAARHPERVSRLVLWSAYPRGEEIGRPEAVEAMVQFIRVNWGLARRAIGEVGYPNGPLEMKKWVAQSLRQSMSPEVATEYVRFQYSVDVSGYLPQVQAPTLVLHRRGSRNAPIGAGRAVAALIPNARFVALEGDVDDWWYGHEQYFPIMLEFLDEDRVQASAPVHPEPGPFRTILFSDVEGSTALTQRLGDEAAREVLREHERVVREQLRAYGGSEVKTMGDGFMASFGSATKALECAVAIQRAVEGEDISTSAHPERPEGAVAGGSRGSEGSPRAGVRVRIGLHAGEPLAEEGDLFGTAVIAAARIAAQAQGGEILVSDVLRGLVAGKGFRFADRGEAMLKGFDEAARLYEVQWRASERSSERNTQV